ncbi:hypothetical protein C5167_020172 [Papaver somniferum]|uniref:Uncharacterized protein n=1 Tax=Papaver somniferum TaxID=3469 RepID=A0A4Y7IVM0_PAPSO|nr:serine/arginine-rich splicing factor RSZ22-like isoform X2 [Papaver somniferum]RZC51752.1 hypothetical protein C5167_020172 [Papaver somniferum]
MDAIRGLDGKNNWRLELSHNSKGGSGGRAGGGRGGRSVSEDLKCYECSEPNWVCGRGVLSSKMGLLLGDSNSKVDLI